MRLHLFKISINFINKVCIGDVFIRFSNRYGTVYDDTKPISTRRWIGFFGLFSTILFCWTKVIASWSYAIWQFVKYSLSLRAIWVWYSRFVFIIWGTTASIGATLSQTLRPTLIIFHFQCLSELMFSLLRGLFY